jgi:hypothetical protein
LPAYSRDSRDYNPMPRSQGPDHYSPPSSGDHYRPYSDPYGSRDLFPNSRADSYRPQYQEDGPWNYHNSMSRNVRARTPDDLGSPRRELRPVYVHRLPVSHTDRKSRHYSPTRPVSDISSHGRRSPSPTPSRFNNPRISDRARSPRHRLRSPGVSPKHELSPPIPGFIHEKQQIPKEIPFWANVFPGTPSKRRSTSPPRDQPPVMKKSRSISPERQSSIASSRRSSPEPVLVVERGLLVQSSIQAMLPDNQPLTSANNIQTQDHIDTGTF